MPSDIDGADRDLSEHEDSAVPLCADWQPLTPEAALVMLVSISKLGSSRRSQGAAARAMVDYLTGKQQRRAGQRGEPAPDLGRDSTPGGYYADSAEQPGRWYGRGAQTMIPDGDRATVRPEMLERLLLGQHPVTGRQLIGASGSAGRAKHADSAGVNVDPTGPAGELLNAAQVAKLIGVEKRYVNDVARRTQQRRSEIEATEHAGTPPPQPAATSLDGHKVRVSGQPTPEWRFRRDEVERFIANRREPDVVLGFDVTYSAAKETSLAWAVADTEGKAAIEQAFRDRAVGAAMTYVEDHAVFVRRTGTEERGDNMIAAAFLHTTSRELEPQLHVHVVVANMATGADGTHRTLDARALYAHGSTSGYLADAEQQTHTNQLGYRSGPTTKGISHIEGFSAETVDAMSSGRKRIMDEVGAVGADSARARQLAALATRPAKDVSVDRDDLQHAWNQRLADTGLTARDIASLTRHSAPLLWSPADTNRLYRHLSSAVGVTEKQAIFDRRHVIETITDHAAGRLDATQIQLLADTWLHSGAALKLDVVDGIQADLIGHVGKVSLTPGLAVYTTPEIVRTEQFILDAYPRGHNNRSGIVPPGLADTAISQWEHATGHTLGADQAAMVRAITSSGDRHQAVIGPAGSGKTAALEVAARAWEAGGYNLQGAAVTGAAAEVLQQATGIRSTTVAGLLTRLDHAESAGRPLLTISSVVIVDEASTLGNRQHARLLHHIETAGATLRTIGDPAQHTSVEAGGMWAHLTRIHTERTPELTENRRMKGAGMADVRLAANDYRNDRIKESIARINDNGRLVTAPTSEQLLDNLVTDWFVDWQHHLADPTGIKASRMLAESHAVRTELNHRAQTVLKAEGHLNGPGIRIGEGTFHVGDRVMARTQSRNLRAHGGDRTSYVRNGNHGTVTNIGKGNRPTLTVDFDHKGKIEVPHDFLTKKLRDGVTGGITPAYAVTTHAAQGDTYNAAFSLVTDRSSTEGQYVAMTRGENDMRYYAVDAAELRTPSPAVEHNLPVVENTTPILEAIPANLQRPKPAAIATAVDTNIAAYLELSQANLSLRELEQLATPIADRVADTLIERTLHQMQTNPPAPLVALIGNRDPGHPTRWDNAAGAYGLYRQRWNLQSDHKHVATPPPQHAPQAQHSDFNAMRTDIIEARADTNRDLTPAQLAAKRASLVTDPAIDVPGHAGVDNFRTKQLTTRVAQLEQLRDQQRSALEAAARPRAVRRNRNGPEVARRAVQQTQQQLDLATAELADHRNTMNRPATGTGTNERRRIELAAVDRIIDHQATTAIATPRSYHTTALGSRPANPEAAARWDRAANAVERYRIGTLGRDPESGPANPNQTGVAHAIGTRPANPNHSARWDAAHNSAIAVTNPIHDQTAARVAQTAIRIGR